jgi:flagellar protein FlaG
MEIQPATAVAVMPQAAPVQREAAPALALVSAPSGATPAPKLEHIKAAVQEIQEFVDNVTTNLQFSVDDRTGRIVVSVVDAETKQVVRQIPSEDVMKLARTLDRMQGLLFTGKA